ncbi:putative polygalacturonase [Cocos nucifera]|uniref:Putative polygalacturonase n=1 Tax=Cocos nucifera TaxID=13894 RepID=A0A8K0IUI1_COCNU|nr:putative polygalacturonase [Cocos nucifera]
MRSRGSAVSVADFGGVGDGRTLNTAAFQRAVAVIERRRPANVTLLYVPPGVWHTGAFNLTSHMTLFLAKGAVIKSTQVRMEQLMAKARSGGICGGEEPYLSQDHIYWSSCILEISLFMVWSSTTHHFGTSTLFIAGENGTIDGQGKVWWNINVVVRNVTLLAPYDSPNTDVVDPDSSLNVCIEDCFISTGDDLVAVKSGWDEYGIAYAHPSSGITVRQLTGSSPFAGIAVGSETSGGVENILVESIDIYNTSIGMHIKTNSGRGGYIRNMTISGMNMNHVRNGLRIKGDVGGHPDDK